MDNSYQTDLLRCWFSLPEASIHTLLDRALQIELSIMDNEVFHPPPPKKKSYNVHCEWCTNHIVATQQQVLIMLAAQEPDSSLLLLLRQAGLTASNDLLSFSLTSLRFNGTQFLVIRYQLINNLSRHTLENMDTSMPEGPKEYNYPAICIGRMGILQDSQQR